MLQMNSCWALLRMSRNLIIIISFGMRLEFTWILDLLGPAQIPSIPLRSTQNVWGRVKYCPTGISCFWLISIRGWINSSHFTCSWLRILPSVQKCQMLRDLSIMTSICGFLLFGSNALSPFLPHFLSSFCLFLCASSVSFCSTSYSAMASRTWPLAACPNCFQSVQKLQVAFHWMTSFISGRSMP